MSLFKTEKIILYLVTFLPIGIMVGSSVSTSMKQQKAIKKNDLQNSVLNLENNNFPVGEYLDNIEEQGFDTKSVTMSFGNIEEMNGWEVKDWANSWRGDLPSELKDGAGNLIEFTDENMQDLKAQLAINTFNNMIDTSTLEIKESMNENIKEIAQVIEASGGFNLDGWLNQDFTITLNNYSQLVGNSYGIEINDFKIKQGTIKKLKELSKKEYYIFIVTNQAGIAKGHFETRDFIKLHKYIKKIMIKKKIKKVIKKKIKNHQQKKNNTSVKISNY